MELPLQCANVC